MSRVCKLLRKKLWHGIIQVKTGTATAHLLRSVGEEDIVACSSATGVMYAGLKHSVGCRVAERLKHGYGGGIPRLNV